MMNDQLHTTGPFLNHQFYLLYEMRSDIFEGLADIQCAAAWADPDIKHFIKTALA